MTIELASRKKAASGKRRRKSGAKRDLFVAGGDVEGY